MPNVGLVPTEIAAGQPARFRAVQAQAGQPAGVDAVGGRRGMRRGFQVGGREAKTAAAHVTADDDALHPVRAAQRAGGGGHVTRGQLLPDVRRGDRYAVGHQQRHALGGEVVFLAQLRQQRHVTHGLMAEPEVLPHHHGGGVQPFGQDDADELIRAEPGEFQVEREHADRVGAEAGEELGPPARGNEQRRMRTGPDHLIRVRIEGDHHDRQLPGPRNLFRPADDALVTAVHAVEHADRRDARTPVGRHFSQAVPAVHVPRSSSAFAARPQVPPDHGCRQSTSLRPQANTTSGLACPDSSVTRAIRVPSGA